MNTADPHADIPTPEALIGKRLARAPAWLRRGALNALAVVSWIGLPATILSKLLDMRWVLDAAQWLYTHAGAVRPVLLVAGEGVTVVVRLWRGLTHPVWEIVAGWVGVTLPAWMPDLLTLLALFALGIARRAFVAGIAGVRSSALVLRRHFAGAWSDDDAAMPRRFPFKTEFAEVGINLSLRRQEETQRLWRKWRKQQIYYALHIRTDRWPRFDQEVVLAQFERYWLGVMEGRRALLIYSIVAALIACGLAVDWAYKAGAFP